MTPDSGPYRPPLNTELGDLGQVRATLKAVRDRYHLVEGDAKNVRAAIAKLDKILEPVDWKPT